MAAGWKKILQSNNDAEGSLAAFGTGDADDQLISHSVKTTAEDLSTIIWDGIATEGALEQTTIAGDATYACLLYTSPSTRDQRGSG